MAYVGKRLPLSNKGLSRTPPSVDEAFVDGPFDDHLGPRRGRRSGTRWLRRAAQARRDVDVHISHIDLSTSCARVRPSICALLPGMSLRGAGHTAFAAVAAVAAATPFAKVTASLLHLLRWLLRRSALR